MHLLAVFVWSAFWASLPVRLVAVSGTVYVLVALLKKFVPQVSGPWAVLVNVALAITGMLSVAKPGDLSSPNFWASLVMTAAAAAGVHGTVRSALGPGSATPPATGDSLPVAQTRPAASSPLSQAYPRSQL